MSEKQPAYLPRPNDLPREKLAKLADQTILQYGGPDRAEVHFKFTCIYCGSRCTLCDPNILYEKGECAHCGKENEITMGGFTIRIKIKA